MNPPYPTAHAAMRMSQRGLANDDIELIRWIGTEVEGGSLVREKDFRALDRELKQLRDQVRKLGWQAVGIGRRSGDPGIPRGRSKQRVLLRDTDT